MTSPHVSTPLGIEDVSCNQTPNSSFRIGLRVFARLAFQDFIAVDLEFSGLFVEQQRGPQTLEARDRLVWDGLVRAPFRSARVEHVGPEAYFARCVESRLGP